jgi:tRNA nucleotidyltransferase (CCA-adding enzyme)
VRAGARERGECLFLVGGVVRDLLLGTPIRDLDLVVEGDAAGLAAEAARRLGGRVRLHGRFRTAVLELPGGGRVDIASSRRESYAHPGALPRVAAAAIEEDLRRRDFTINAMAIEIAPASRPTLLDPFGGRVDLARKRLRFLHDRSAFDDPTRAFRAVRYANRLGLELEPGTARAIRRALASGAFLELSGDRLRRELALIFAEPGAARAAVLLARFGLAGTLGARLPVGRAERARLSRAEHLARVWPEVAGWSLFLLAWAAGRSPSELRRIADRLAAAGDSRQALLRWTKTRRLLPRLSRVERPSTTHRLLKGLTPLEGAALSVCLPSGAAECVLAAAHGSARLAISGRDLVASGVAPGPAIGRALRETLEARLDGRLSAREELAFAVRRAKGGRVAT